MPRHQYFTIVMIICLTVFVSACVKEKDEIPDKQKNDYLNQHKESMSSGIGFVDVIKRKKLIKYQSATIGDAFDSYRHLTKKEWKESPSKSGYVTVDFTGWFESSVLNDTDIKNGVTDRGINVKFVIEPNGTFYAFMASKIEVMSDGKIFAFQLGDMDGILASIYANRSIKL